MGIPNKFVEMELLGAVLKLDFPSITNLLIKTGLSERSTKYNSLQRGMLQRVLRYASMMYTHMEFGNEENIFSELWEKNPDTLYNKDYDYCVREVIHRFAAGHIDPLLFTEALHLTDVSCKSCHTGLRPELVDSIVESLKNGIDEGPLYWEVPRDLKDEFVGLETNVIAEEVFRYCRNTHCTTTCYADSRDYIYLVTFGFHKEGVAAIFRVLRDEKQELSPEEMKVLLDELAFDCGYTESEVFSAILNSLKPAFDEGTITMSSKDMDEEPLIRAIKYFDAEATFGTLMEEHGILPLVDTVGEIGSRTGDYSEKRPENNSTPAYQRGEIIREVLNKASTVFLMAEHYGSEAMKGELIKLANYGMIDADGIDSEFMTTFFDTVLRYTIEHVGIESVLEALLRNNPQDSCDSLNSVTVSYNYWTLMYNGSIDKAMEPFLYDTGIDGVRYVLKAKKEKRMEVSPVLKRSILKCLHKHCGYRKSAILYEMGCRVLLG